MCMAKYFFHDKILFGILQNHFPDVILYWEVQPKYSSEIKFEYQKSHPNHDFKCKNQTSNNKV